MTEREYGGENIVSYTVKVEFMNNSKNQCIVGNIETTNVAYLMKNKKYTRNDPLCL